MAFEVHREPLYRRYYAKTFTGACCYTICFGFLLIFLPLIIAYNSSTFWLKDNIVYEQPAVKYRYQAIFQLSGINGDGLPISLFYSTSNTINSLFGNHLRIPVVKSAELDDNRDGKVDRIEVNMQMPLKELEQVTGISAAFIHEVKLSDKARYIFDSLAYINYESATSLSSLNIDGDLMIRQTTSLYSKGGYRNPYEDDPLLSLSSDMSAYEASISYLASKASARNLTLNFQPNYIIPTRLGYVYKDNTLPTFNATIIQRIPIQGIRYTPPVSETLKYAWIQYISFFAVISFLLFRLNSFIFRHQLFHTHAVADIVVEKMD